MGRSFTPKYVVRSIRATADGKPTGIGFLDWDGKYDGRANAANLARKIDRMNQSFLPGGANDHLAGTVITGAALYRNTAGGAPVATYGTFRV